MPRSEPGLLVMCFYMVGDTGLEPVHVGIKIRCLTNLANLQLNMIVVRGLASSTFLPHLYYYHIETH